MTASILPTASELAGITTLEEARRWAGSRDPAWSAWPTAVGQVPSLRVLANIATSAFKETLALVRIASTSGGDPRELSVVEAIQLALVWRVARQAYGMEDVDPLADLGSGSPSSPAAGASVTSPPSAKRVKAASVIDQLDESDVPLLTQAQLDEAYRHHAEVTGADPPADAEPTGEQIAALKTRVVDRGESPYADFSVLTPYGRRVQKQMKARSWLLQQDGTFRALDVPGPPSFDTWVELLGPFEGRRQLRWKALSEGQRGTLFHELRRGRDLLQVRQGPGKQLPRALQGGARPCLSDLFGASPECTMSQGLKRFWQKQRWYRWRQEQVEEVTRRRCWQLVNGGGHTASGSAAGRSWHRGRRGRDDAFTAGSANAETEIPRALCRHGWLVDSRERIGWRPGRGPRAEGHLRQLGHSHGGGLPSGVHSRGRSRLDTCCIPVQILLKGQTVRPVWNCSGGALRLTSRRLGTPPCRGRKRHLEENHRSGLQGDRKRQVLQHGEPQRLLYAWSIKIMEQLRKCMHAELVHLDQCPYGAETVKPTGIMASAPWMKTVCLTCKQVRPHRHRPGGLTGFVWDPLDDQWVWRTSKAAEYLAGLCWAWAMSLRQWIHSEAGQHWLEP